MNKKRKKIVANIIVIILIACGVAWIASLFIHLGGEYTNNAQVRRDIVTVSARVQGFIKEIRFEEFQHVKKGDTLVLIEDSEFRLHLAQAQADYQNAQIAEKAMGTSISTTQNNIAVNDAGIDEVKILLDNAEKDFNRYKKLLDNGAVTRSQFDGVKTQYESLKAKVETMKRQKNSTKLVRAEQTQRLQQNTLNIDVCAAALELAKLNLSYTFIIAPCDGFTSRKTIQQGELVMPGKNLLSIVNDQNIWIVANFRETQRQQLKIGGKVEIKIDAFPDTKFEGRIESISNATGAQYSVVSPDNSAGNFVKVEQRIPVKIVFTENNNADLVSQLSSGINVECKAIY